MSYILDINNAIAQSVATVKANAKKNGWTMREPDYVAALTTEFPKRIAGLIPGVRYGGCFIHQRPLITFTSTIDGNQHRCELGDLLIICRKTVDGKERYNAALLQFKKANSKCLTIYKPSELRQLEASPRLRQAYDLRNSEKDNSQRMLNAPEPGTVMPIHRHRKTSESICMVQVEVGQWHLLEVLDGRIREPNLNLSKRGEAWRVGAAWKRRAN